MRGFLIFFLIYYKIISGYKLTIMNKKICDNKKSASSCSLSRYNFILVAVIMAIAVFTAWIFNSSTKIVKHGNSADSLNQEFNVGLSLPVENIGSLDVVPKEKVDPLFENILD